MSALMSDEIPAPIATGVILICCIVAALTGGGDWALVKAVAAGWWGPPANDGKPDISWFDGEPKSDTPEACGGPAEAAGIDGRQAAGVVSGIPD